MYGKPVFGTSWHKEDCINVLLDVYFNLFMFEQNSDYVNCIEKQRKDLNTRRTDLNSVSFSRRLVNTVCLTAQSHIPLPFKATYIILEWKYGSRNWISKAHINIKYLLIPEIGLIYEYRQSDRQ